MIGTAWDELNRRQFLVQLASSATLFFGRESTSPIAMIVLTLIVLTLIALTLIT